MLEAAFAARPDRTGGTNRSIARPADLAVAERVEHAADLPTIDLDATVAVGGHLDRRTYEERFAELGFGLGVVPRKQHRDDPWWATTGGLLGLVGTALALVWLLASAH